MIAFDQNLTIILSFIADWLLFVFPFMQAVIELSEYSAMLENYKTVSATFKRVSPWFWLFPPVKVHLENNRLKKIARSAHFSKKDHHDMLGFELKGTAWFFVSLAGIFNGFGATLEVIEHFHFGHENLLFWLINLLMIIVGISTVAIRMAFAGRTVEKFG
ncbi:hypothetical protein [Eupransor demetentiae]|uniref:DUF4328 domain-containing protein n=1 Tax=Eupransor demetentiae TaxID=3109584 RepID=A0ABM9N5L6_9LACO|nr:hypothetical protein R54876_GBNLAHCA_01004 [Lactobacillaceae bacterium LMG 33000]